MVSLLVGSGPAAAAEHGNRAHQSDLTAQAGEWYKNSYTLQCLDDSNEFGLRVYHCNGSNYQNWYPKRWPDGSIELRNVQTGMCVDDSLQFGLRRFYCNSQSYQRWYWRSTGDVNRHQWQNQQTGRCMEASVAMDHRLRAATCHLSGDQFWW